MKMIVHTNINTISEKNGLRKKKTYKLSKIVMERTGFKRINKYFEKWKYK